MPKTFTLVVLLLFLGGAMAGLLFKKSLLAKAIAILVLSIAFHVALGLSLMALGTYFAVRFFKEWRSAAQLEH